MLRAGRAPMPARRNRALLASSVLCAGLVVSLSPGDASALEPEVTSDTAVQFYDVRSPTGENVISRRRLTTTLGVSVYDLYDTPSDPTGPTLSFRARMRYDADYGGAGAETDPTSRGV